MDIDRIEARKRVCRDLIAAKVEIARKGVSKGAS